MNVHSATTLTQLMAIAKNRKISGRSKYTKATMENLRRRIINNMNKSPSAPASVDVVVVNNKNKVRTIKTLAGLKNIAKARGMKGLSKYTAASKNNLRRRILNNMAPRSPAPAPRSPARPQAPAPEWTKKNGANTRVYRCVEKLRQTKPLSAAIAICQKSTKQSYKTGESLLPSSSPAPARSPTPAPEWTKKNGANTRVYRCVEKLRQTKPLSAAIAICQKSTKQSYKTGNVLKNVI
ncbi:hypothetical protein N9C10_03540 [Flavobacteriaceae bacterium]|nr:hypothetical protein [Flavobacteriaceae bacterium]